jgi:hypothetical protein
VRFSADMKMEAANLHARRVLDDVWTVMGRAIEHGLKIETQ